MHGSRSRPRDGEEAELIHGLFQARAQQHDGRIALSCGTQTWTYAELNGRANQLARQLQRLDVGPERLAAIYLDRGPDMIAAILAVLKAGGAYLPIDLAYPADRIRFMLQDARPAVLVTEHKLAGNLPQPDCPVVCIDSEGDPIKGESPADLPVDVNPNNAAYVIYTSGSTGTPKGVIVTHANVVRLFRSTEHWFQFSSEDVWALFHSVAFDFSVWEIWGALFYGGRLVIVPYLVSRSPEAFHELLWREKVTVLNQTPSAFRQLIWADQKSPGDRELDLRYVIFGGEALELQSLRPWLARHGDARPRLVNMYGITETTVHVTYRPITLQDLAAQRGSVIGRPIPDLSLHILDERRQPCGIGVAGELYVGGAGVARGYLHRPELTEERFVPDPFSSRPEDCLYRSGDLARRLPDGDVEYLGRADQQVKIRGFRIELGEIEAALNAHLSVRDCVVDAQATPHGDRQLVAYLVCDPERPHTEELRSFLSQTLPEYMIPGQFVFLDRLPLTVHGKIDRRALPAPSPERPEIGNEFVAPSTPEEEILAAIWRDVLRRNEVGIHDNFFALGGDSIRSIQVLARAQEHGLKLSLEQLFEKPTISQLARLHPTCDRDSLTAPSAPFACLGEADRARIPEGIEDAYPLARLQMGMVYHNSLAPDSAIFHDVFSFQFQLPFEEDKLREAIARLAARHPIYRTSFDFGTFSEPMQRVHEHVTIPLTIEDIRSRTVDAQHAALVEWVELEKRRPFDWNVPPFIRLHVQRLQDDLFQFIVSFHHVIMDGWSLAAMLTELFQEYSARLDGAHLEIPPPPVCYRDFVMLERQAMHSDEVRAFWKTKLEQPTIHTLPRWPAELRKRGQEQVRGPELHIDPEIVLGLKQLANTAGVPFRTVLLAAHCRVLNVLTGQSDMITGLVSNGRPQVIGGERLIGLFLNTLPFRISMEGGTWRELVQQTFAAERELIPYRRCPMPEIQQLLGGQPLFETVFDFVQFHVYRDLPGYEENSFLEGHYFEANNFTFYLTCMLDASGSKLQIHCDYDPNALCEPQVQAISEYYLNTLAAMALEPGSPYQSHSPLPSEERQRLLVEWNQTAAGYPAEQGVHQLIEEQAARTPEAVAAVFENESITYAELDRRAAVLAQRLSGLGAGPDRLVGIHLERSLEMLVALLAVWKAGGAYVPLDPSYPKERLDFMMEDAGLQLVLTNETDGMLDPSRERRVLPVSAVLAGTDASAAATTPAAALKPEPLAYVIYTSGSTGKPKGVQIRHRALVNFLESMRRAPGLTAADTLLAVTTLSFDIAALELFLPLIAGGRVVIASSETALDPQAIAAQIASHQVTTVQATPTTWRLLVQSGWTGDKRLKALCGGEAMPRDLANSLAGLCGEVWNMYGPTETTVWSCIDRVAVGEGAVPVGRPIANTQVYLLDPRGHLVPAGCEGEIYIGGDGLALGYLGSPNLTAARFVNVAMNGTSPVRLYRTGDLGRYLPDGRIVCSGRTDDQVKIRGFRIELEEIETVLAAHRAVAAVVVAARQDKGTDKRLVAYYSLRQAAAVSDRELRDFLHSKLPPYMVPSAFVQMHEFPLTPNGKVARAQLPEPPGTRPDVGIEFVAPRTPIEELVAQLWKEVLQVDRVGIKDDFFALGGHSLLAIQMIGRLRHELQIDLNVAALFERPSIESFALHIIEQLLDRDGQGGGNSKDDTAEFLPEQTEAKHSPKVSNS